MANQGPRNACNVGIKLHSIIKNVWSLEDCVLSLIPTPLAQYQRMDLCHEGLFILQYYQPNYDNRHTHNNICTLTNKAILLIL